MTTRKLRKYRKQVKRDKAYVAIDGKRIYLKGTYQSPESLQDYDRVVGEWLASGGVAREAGGSLVTVTQLAAQWEAWAKEYYPPNSQYGGNRATVKIVTELFGDLPAESLGPRLLQHLQNQLVERDLCRSYINNTSARIKQMYRWGVV